MISVYNRRYEKKKRKIYLEYFILQFLDIIERQPQKWKKIIKILDILYISLENQNI